MNYQKTIKLKIHEEEDLYSPLDPDQKTLSEDVLTYLTREFLNVHGNNLDQYIMRIYSDTPVDKEKVDRNIRDYFTREKDFIKKSMGRLTMKAICIAVVGLAVLSLWVYLSATREGVRMEVLSITGGLAIWEAVNIMIIERPELFRLKCNLNKLIHAEIMISDPSEETAAAQDQRSEI